MNDQTQTTIAGGLTGRYVIVRARDAGVHAGVLEAQSGREVLLSNARRLWYWKCASGHSLNGVAVSGLGKGSKIPAAVEQISILDACEIITVTDAARASIEGFATYEP